jgi:hypothetical protein
VLVAWDWDWGVTAVEAAAAEEEVDAVALSTWCRPSDAAVSSESLIALANLYASSASC